MAATTDIAKARVPGLAPSVNSPAAIPPSEAPRTNTASRYIVTANTPPSTPPVRPQNSATALFPSDRSKPTAAAAYPPTSTPNSPSTNLKARYPKKHISAPAMTHADR